MRLEVRTVGMHTSKSKTSTFVCICLRKCINKAKHVASLSARELSPSTSTLTSDMQCNTDEAAGSRYQDPVDSWSMAIPSGE
eukprot:141372-Pyramimonas_sp.AAC.2